MIDTDCFQGVAKAMSLADHTRRPDIHDAADEFGSVQVVLFGDFKQFRDRQTLLNLAVAKRDAFGANAVG